MRPCPLLPPQFSAPAHDIYVHILGSTSFIYTHVSNINVQHMITKTINSVHYKESKQTTIHQSFTHLKLLMGNLPKFFAKHSHYTVIPQTKHYQHNLILIILANCFKFTKVTLHSLSILSILIPFKTPLKVYLYNHWMVVAKISSVTTSVIALQLVGMAKNCKQFFAIFAQIF